MRDSKRFPEDENERDKTEQQDRISSAQRGLGCDLVGNEDYVVSRADLSPDACDKRDLINKYSLVSACVINP